MDPQVLLVTLIKRKLEGLSGMPGLPEVLEKWAHPGLIQSFGSNSRLKLSLPTDPIPQDSETFCPLRPGQPCISNWHRKSAMQPLCPGLTPGKKQQYCLAVAHFLNNIWNVRLENHYHHWDIEKFNPSKNFPLPFSIPKPQETTDLLSITIVLPFAESCIKGKTQYASF